MSIARHLLNEFRPLFRMLEEPLGRRSGAFGIPARSVFDDPFFHSPAFARPAVDISEDGNHYVVETELPGVKKEDVEVRIGDGGRSVTIEGNIVQRRIQGSPNGSAVSSSNTPQVEGAAEGKQKRGNPGSTAVQTTQGDSNQLAVERSFTGSSRFTRTVWLPRAADANNVSAKLADGILTLKIAKAEERDAVKINIE
ncbi:HSP20-like chaperone [Gloeopeniophorella convolvens]|nr:HSP20-like chaperone [Gloeopeniophorella convolvens]